MRTQPLTRAAIVAAARRIADAEGLAGLTLRRVAQELNTGQASLYRHIADRRELLALLNDDLARSFPLPQYGTPREGLTGQWLGAHRILCEHPWAARVIIEADSVTAAALPFAESAMAGFRAAGLDSATAARAYRATWHLLLGHVVNEHPLGHPGEPLDPAEFPELVLARTQLDAVDAEDDFAWALRRLLDGLLGAQPS